MNGNERHTVRSADPSISISFRVAIATVPFSTSYNTDFGTCGTFNTTEVPASFTQYVTFSASKSSLVIAFEIRDIHKEKYPVLTVSNFFINPKSFPD